MINRDMIDAFLDLSVVTFAMFNLRDMLKRWLIGSTTVTATVCFSIWGVVNLAFYSFAGQHWAAIGAMLTLFLTSLSVVLIIYIRQNPDRNAS